MMQDVFQRVQLEDEPAYVVTRDLLYADDTLLASRHASNLQRLLAAVVEEGARYGLELNWSKTVQMQISTQECITIPGGDAIKCVRQAVYLGGLVTCDGRAKSEISRRLGECGRLFDTLHGLWAHASVTQVRKLEIYRACVVSKLVHSIESLWLLQADRARIDAFHCKCLRKIRAIRPSYVSRISNQTVLERNVRNPGRLRESRSCKGLGGNGGRHKPRKNIALAMHVEIWPVTRQKTTHQNPRYYVYTRMGSKKRHSCHLWRGLPGHLRPAGDQWNAVETISGALPDWILDSRRLLR